ncbi:MAG: DUF1501 domain-containing protein [Planctomycetes bacterium]|nr:DUF1501 domain-containing protein [Planctomycetota bacterium]
MNPFTNPSRRDALRMMSSGFGMLALNGIAASQVSQQTSAALPGRAKRVIFLCMTGAPSHVDTFDHKPMLTKRDGASLSGFRRGAKLMGSPWAFKPGGESGLMISELLPEIGKQADHLCLLRGMHTDVPAHAQATTKLHTGSFQFVRPSMGAWTLYGLGTENENLPGFVTLNPPRNQGGAQNYGSSFLPATFQGVPIKVGGGQRGRQAEDPVADIRNPRQSDKQQRAQLDLLRKLNETNARRRKGSDDIEAVIQSYELAFRMQSELPELLDISKEKKRTLEAYGIGEAETDAFGRQCLTARHLAEAGVRFIEVGMGGWDHHRNLREDLPAKCREIDKPIAALLADLDRSGMLEETLVVWSGEFGRTPFAQNGDGRDHNNRGFTSWMAGGGVKGGFSYGATDENGIEAVEGRVSIHDWHATILHIMGLDHERLTYPYAGRDFRLTDVHGEVARDILA